MNPSQDRDGFPGIKDRVGAAAVEPRLRFWT